MAAETKEVIHRNATPLKVVLTQHNQGYYWEIHVSGSTLAEIMPLLREANNKLKGEYGGKK